MKFSKQQLNKINVFPYNVEFDYDFSSFLKSSRSDLDTDIIDVKFAHAKISIVKLEMDTYKFNYTVDTELILLCALTLEPVNYPMHLEFNEIYTDDDNLINSSDDYYPYENNTIDTVDAVWSNIVINIPIRVVREDAYEILKSRNIVLDEIPNDIEN